MYDIKKVLITGATSGMGAAITQHLIERAVSVVGIARHHEKLSVDKTLYFPYQIDCSQLENLENQFKSIRSDHNDIDALICCCGYGHFAELEQFSFDAMQKIMNVNFLSQALLIKTFISQLKKRPSGKIIVMGSESALLGQKKGSLYCASKFALRGFIQSVRQECRSANVAVTMIHPGFVDTPFFDDLDFRPGYEAAQTIQSAQVAAMVDLVLSLQNNCVVEEIHCQPMTKVLVRHA